MPIKKKKKLEAPSAAVEPPEPEGAEFPIVGIGASAGGLAAFEAFFAGMPAEVDPGMAFVLVQHLDPDHKSILTDLIRRYTCMQVFEVENGMKVQPNCAYIIPPKRDMAFMNGTLQLLEQAAPRGQRLPIDFFFRSLAQDQRERAICIVLSGTGSDGTQGVRAIKGEGGMAMVQTPNSSEYDGMPRSAIATGLVDYVLPASGMGAQLISYTTKAFGMRAQLAGVQAPRAENALKKILALLRVQTGHDFSGYKPSTIQRRIQRRMVVNQIETMEAYVKVLQQTPAEAELLMRDLLIGVTSFFRDPATFQMLEQQVIPRLFADRPAGSVLRAWVPGCSSGEEAYSLAMLLAERQDLLKKSFQVQIFATDLDSQAIAAARVGRYPASISADLSPERLRRFFTPEPEVEGGNPDAYRIHKGLRDLLVFSEQDLIKDPPFSKLDLISCRNLLIYLGGDLQKKLIPMFHYALNPGGFLFLGTSETVSGFEDLFTPLERKAKLYQRKEYNFGTPGATLNRFLAPVSAIEAGLPRPGRPVKAVFPMKTRPRQPLRELIEQMLLEHVAPAAALVNGQGDILYLHGRTGLFLEPAPGETGVNNILKMAREGLRFELGLALQTAVAKKERVRRPGLQVRTNGNFSTVDLSIQPVAGDLAGSSEPPVYLVTMAESGINHKPPVSTEQSSGGVELPSGKAGKDDRAERRVEALKQELRIKEEYLQSANEELETSNEELKSSNEEMQSVNEELQSTNEELETSKEELQSVNEELATVNVELQTKLADLSLINNDMNNLLSGTGIGTVFVDHQLRILRFTPAAAQIINLIPGDMGRPVGHIASNLVGYDRLVADVKTVLDSLVPRELEVQVLTGEWYMLRILPYRTLTNVIEGAVITFVDITEMKNTRLALQKANELARLAVVLQDAQDAITVQDLDGRILAWNPGAVRMYGWSEAEALKMNTRERIPRGLREEALAKVRQLSQAEILEPHRTQRICKDGRVFEVVIVSTALMNETGEMYAIATTERALGSEK
jgi:two-component system CheB/CheR fusion protein